MKRRDFLKITPSISLPFLLNGLPLTATAQHPVLQLLREQTISNGKVLVLIQMNGGNDGLNTLIPLDQYSQLMNARGNLVIPANKVLTLNGVPQTGLNPALTGMQALYNNEQMNIVQAVSYPNPSFSHFRATDILFTGSKSSVYLNTGWLGRTLDTSYPGYPDNYPNAEMPDPLSIQIGTHASLVTQCNNINPTVNITDPSAFTNLVNGIVDPAPDTPYGHELTFLRFIKQQTNAYTSIISNAYNSTANMVSYPGDNDLANQLKIVARLIKGGLKTPVYVVSHSGSFDTHAKQVELLDTTVGTHAKLLATLSEAVSVFQQDLNAMQISNRVAAMTFTEFGRRIKSNDSLGTDHGTSTPIFFFGASLNPTIIGTNPQIPVNVTVDDQVPMQHDFRAVYYTVLKDWFELTDAQLLSVFPDAYTTLPIFKQLVALPVQLLSFTGKWLSTKVDLQFEVDNETNIDYYEVMRSDDGANFTKIGTVNAINTSIKHTYAYSDLFLSKSFYYYRIKIVEKSAAVEYSSVLLLKANQSSNALNIKVAPNPVTDSFTVSFENTVSGALTVQLTDLTGKEVWKQEKEVSNIYNQRFSLQNKKPAAGIYVLNVYTKKEAVTVKLVIQ